jgi:hypothetical protein
MKERSWLFRSVGWGHDELEWRRIASALRPAGYDHVISIEHEDALASIDEGLRSAVNFLSRILLAEPPVDAWWVYLCYRACWAPYPGEHSAVESLSICCSRPLPMRRQSIYRLRGGS